MDEEAPIPHEDLKVEAFRVRPGPASAIADSAVRITHLPTGIVVEESGNGSQLRNRSVALQRLYALLAEAES